MNIAGQQRVELPPDRLWASLNDPELLRRAIPGCERLEATGPGSYTGTVTAEAAPVRGTYRGTVEVHDVQPPTAHRLRVRAAGEPGSVDADAAVRLEADGGGTVVAYEAEVTLDGRIAGAGRRVLEGVARRLVGDFLASLERELALAGATSTAGDGEGVGGPAGERVAGAPARAVDTPDPGSGARTAGRAAAAVAGTDQEAGSGAASATPDRRALERVGALLLGAAAALLGFLLGRRGR